MLGLYEGPGEFSVLILTVGLGVKVGLGDGLGLTVGLGVVPVIFTVVIDLGLTVVAVTDLIEGDRDW